MAESLDRHEGGLEPGEDYEGLLFAQATFDDTTAGSWHFLDCSGGRPPESIEPDGDEDHRTF